MSKLENIVKKVLNEAAKINFAGHSFILKVDTNEDPQKKGVKVQFLPTEFGSITATEQNDIAIELETRLEAGLAQYDMKVENVPTKVLEKGPEKLILAHNYEEQDVIGWFMSEKIDGIRAYWDGNKLWSRTGKEINASQSFLENFPKETTLTQKYLVLVDFFIEVKSNKITYVKIYFFTLKLNFYFY